MLTTIRIKKPLVDTGDFAFTDRKRAGKSKGTFKTRYRDDPVGFVLDCVALDDPAPYQLEALDMLAKQRRTCVRSPHGTGKTAMAALSILWFALTRDGQDWKVPTTASAWRQLEKYLWPEVHKWARRVDWAKVGRAPLSDRELLDRSLKLSTGEAFALASDNAALLEGAHADTLLYVFDEAKEIPPATWDAAEGAFSAGECYALAISTPGEPAGRFYDIQSRKPGYADWWVSHWTLAEGVASGRISQEWADQRRAQWGEKSAVYQNRVEGEFAATGGDGVIPLAWVERANENWHAWQKGPLQTVGADIARYGEDKTVLALASGLAVLELRKYGQEDTMQTAGRIAGALSLGGRAVIDVIGIGAGPYDRLLEQGHDVLPFNAAEGTDRRDKSGELGFANVRSASWWFLRELMEDGKVALPPDDELTGDLTAPTWRTLSGGRIQVEAKDDIRKRLGRSTDCGDAVIMALVGSDLCGGAQFGLAKTRLRG